MALVSMTVSHHHLPAESKTATRIVSCGHPSDILLLSIKRVLLSGGFERNTQNLLLRGALYTASTYRNLAFWPPVAWATFLFQDLRGQLQLVDLEKDFSRGNEHLQESISSVTVRFLSAFRCAFTYFSVLSDIPWLPFCSLRDWRTYSATPVS